MALNNPRSGKLVRTGLRAAGGGLAVVAVAAALGSAPDARAAKKTTSVFVPVTANVVGSSNVAGNEIIEIAFSAPVDPTSVSPATLYVQEKNATGTGYTKQIFGSYQVEGAFARFYPRFPTHLRDPETGRFYGEASSLDNADANAGLKPSKDYQLFLIGRPNVTTIRSARKKPLKNNYFGRFTTAAATSAEKQYTTATYGDAPPPEAAFTNPSDTFPTARTQYATFGGTRGVPNDLTIQVYCTKVPLAPRLARTVGNVELTLVERNGSTAVRRPVPGRVFVEQNFETTLLAFEPRFPLADKAVYALRVTKNVRDLTEQYDFDTNRQRERLRAMYDQLSAARSLNPTTAPENLPDPDDALTGDWPEDPAERGVLKANLLKLGDTRVDEIDPRTAVIFTTRDEPITNASLTINFTKTENLFDSSLSTGEWDQSIPGAASAIFTISGGSAALGDLTPTAGTVFLNGDSQPGSTFNYRTINIPSGVTVSITGTRPVTLKAIDFTLNGAIDVSGGVGQVGRSKSGSAPTTAEVAPGGVGGPGGGVGGIATTSFTGGAAGGTGGRGTDSDGGNPSTFGGLGGLGGKLATGSYYAYAGGGGGGGGRTAGKDGQAGQAVPGLAFYASWNGTGGLGGAGSSNTTLTPLVGGAGGGASGNSMASNWAASWGYRSGGSGGGGGGAILIQTARTLTVGTGGRVRANGGAGAAMTIISGTGAPGGPGGGGGGGSILLRSTGGFNFGNPAANFEVKGGLGGAGTGSYPNVGGAGGDGYLRTEDPNGGIALTNGSQGSFDPVGGGVPSYVYSKWADLGVQDPVVVPWSKADIVTNPASNDAVLVECQMTREDTTVFETPDLTALNASQNSTNLAKTSAWTPLKIHDLTGIPGGAFQPVGWSLGADGPEFAGFPISTLNGRGYRFIRFRIFFQLDGAQRLTDAFPNVDQIVTHFQFNL